MKKTLLLSGVLLLGLLLIGCSGLLSQNRGGADYVGDAVAPTPADPNAQPPDWQVSVRIEGEYRPGEVLIGYSSEAAVHEAAALVGGSVVDRSSRLQVAKVDVPGAVPAALGRIMQAVRRGELRDVRFVEPNYTRELIEPRREDRAMVTELGPRVYDPAVDLRPRQWGLDMVNAEAAWAHATGQGVIVAVLDSGVDGTHPDLEGQMEPQWFDAASGTWVAGLDSDTQGHGTHVAGIVAARNDGAGITGLAPGARILSVRIFDPSFVGDYEAAVAILEAVDYGAQVLNNSWGGKAFSQTLQAAVAYALANDAVFVVSMGNDHMDEIMFPAAYPGAIGVGATNPDDRKADFSTTGGYISVSAPGERILSCVPTWYVQEGTGTNHHYEYQGGTSMAAPFVSALAGLVLERHPGAAPHQVRRVLESTAEDVESGGFDRRTGYGRIDAGAGAGVTVLPADGGQVEVYVTTESGLNWPFNLPYVDVMLRRGGVDRYFGQTDLEGWSELGYPEDPGGIFGVAPFHGIEPGTYEVIVGGEDVTAYWWTGWSRVANRVTARGTVTVGAGGLETVTLTLNSELEVIVDFQDDVGARLAVWEGDTFATAWSVWEAPPASGDWGSWSGTATEQAYKLDPVHWDWDVYYLAIDATGATGDAVATVTVIQNGVSEVYGPYAVEAGGFYPSYGWPDWWENTPHWYFGLDGPGGPFVY